MRFFEALVIVSKPKLDSVSSNQQWLTFLGKLKEFLSSSKNSRQIAENCVLLTLDSNAKNFLRAITQTELRYKAYLVWDMPLDIIQSFDPTYQVL